MKIRELVCTALATLALSGSMVQADTVPSNLQGGYIGTLKIAYYENGQAVKSKGTCVIDLSANTWSASLVDSTGGSSTFTGPVKAAGPYIFTSGTAPTSVIGGRLQTKGKPGKAALSGLLVLGADGVSGLADVTVKAKQVP